MKKFIHLSLFLMLVSCGETDSPVESISGESPSIIKEDSISSEPVVEADVENGNIEIDVDKLLSKIDTTYSTPFLLDSAFVEEIENLSKGESTLTNEEVQYLSFDLVKNQPTDWSNYSISSFIEIDSMRMMNTYEEYLETIDIGMIQESEAHVFSKIQINETAFILMWSISYSSFEACPFSSGTVIFGTFFNNNIAFNTATLGENSGGGDAPYWGDTFITSEIHPTSISTRKIDQNGGEEDEKTGEEIIEKTDKTYHLKITQSGFDVIGQ